MKITIEVNGKPVEIELTKEQIAKVTKPLHITERVKTFEDACEILGYSVPKSMHIVDKLKVIIEALNEGWTPDWSNSSQYKYTPYFKHDGTAFVFCVCNSWYSVSNVGSRLCFKDAKLCEYCAKQFIDLYNEFLG